MQQQRGSSKQQRDSGGFSPNESQYGMHLPYQNIRQISQYSKHQIEESREFEEYETVKSYIIYFPHHNIENIVKQMMMIGRKQNVEIVKVSWWHRKNTRKITNEYEETVIRKKTALKFKFRQMANKLLANMKMFQNFQLKMKFQKIIEQDVYY